MEPRVKASDGADKKPRGTVDEESEQTNQTTAEQEIRDRAYEIYLQRGEQHGSDLDDWLQAERELSTRSPA
jgi:hypothetical protein